MTPEKEKEAKDRREQVAKEDETKPAAKLGGKRLSCGPFWAR